jgi:hypothetical protein
LPDLNDLLRQLGATAREAAVLGLFVTGFIIVLVRDWRVTLLALLGQYVMVGVVLSRLVLPEIALIKTLIGALICPMLYLAARQSGWSLFSLPAVIERILRRGRPDAESLSVFRVGRSFRVLAVTLVLVLAIVINQAYAIPHLPPDVGLSCYWLMLVGILVLMLTEEPLKAGPGLLTMLTGFELMYTPLESSLTVVFLWAVVNLLLGLAISYLSAARSASTRRGGL